MCNFTTELPLGTAVFQLYIRTDMSEPLVARRCAKTPQMESKTQDEIVWVRFIGFKYMRF